MGKTGLEPVGKTGLEPVTSTMSTWRSNRLSYLPDLGSERTTAVAPVSITEIISNWFEPSGQRILSNAAVKFRSNHPVRVYRRIQDCATNRLPRAK